MSDTREEEKQMKKLIADESKRQIGVNEFATLLLNHPHCHVVIKSESGTFDEITKAMLASGGISHPESLRKNHFGSAMNNQSRPN